MTFSIVVGGEDAPPTGGMIPAATLAYSTEVLVAAIFVVIWRFDHVLVERSKLSVLTGRFSESEMQEYHRLEYERLTAPEGRGE